MQHAVLQRLEYVCVCRMGGFFWSLSRRYNAQRVHMQVLDIFDCYDARRPPLFSDICVDNSKLVDGCCVSACLVGFPSRIQVEIDWKSTGLIS